MGEEILHQWPCWDSGRITHARLVRSRYGLTINYRRGADGSDVANIPLGGGVDDETNGAQAREMAIAILEATGGVPGRAYLTEKGAEICREALSKPAMDDAAYGWGETGPDLAKETLGVQREIEAMKATAAFEFARAEHIRRGDCPHCSGTGNTGFISTIRCERCNGTGQA